MIEKRNLRQRRFLVGLAALFFVPLGLSFYLFYGHSSLTPGNRVNRGALIDPVRPMPPLSVALLGAGRTAPDFLQHKWTILYANVGACTDICRAKLYDTRQVRLALDRDMGRVQRVLVADADCCDPQFLQAEHPDLISVRAADAAPLLEGLPQGSGRIYVIDPLGNLMMSYAPDAAPKALLEDMKRLLRLSHIG
jgi:cytochrome oxidase Cu insertion factor (SCO1/SenC/PrrC family)